MALMMMTSPLIPTNNLPSTAGGAYRAKHMIREVMMV